MGEVGCGVGCGGSLGGSAVGRRVFLIGGSDSARGALRGVRGSRIPSGARCGGDQCFGIGTGVGAACELLADDPPGGCGGPVGAVGISRSEIMLWSSTLMLCDVLPLPSSKATRRCPREADELRDIDIRGGVTSIGCSPGGAGGPGGCPPSWSCPTSIEEMSSRMVVSCSSPGWTS